MQDTVTQDATTHDTRYNDTTIPDLDERARAIDDALKLVNELEPSACDLAIALKTAVEDFYVSGIKRIVRVLRDDVGGGVEILRLLSADPEIRTLLLSSGILRSGPSERTYRAIESIKPYLNSQGGDVDLVKVSPPTAYLRFSGACNGCSTTSTELVRLVHEKILAEVEEITKIETVDDEQPDFIRMGRTRRSDQGWVAGPDADRVGPLGVYPVVLSGQKLIITSIGDRLSCFRNSCAHLGMELDRATIEPDGTLTCPWHRFCYDALTGECITVPGVELERFPVRIEDGVIKVKLS